MPGLNFREDRSLALLTDQYELTMAKAYWKNGLAEADACFQMTFRRLPFQGGFVVLAGLEPLLEWLAHFRFSAGDLGYLDTLKDNGGHPLFEEPFLRYLEAMRFSCDVNAVREGTVVFPNEPLIRVQGPVIQAQLVESAVLNMLNFQSLVATKAARCWLAAKGDAVVEFGLRRAQGPDGALAASRAAYIGGCTGTSNTLAGKLFGIPVLGTHAHSWVMVFSHERDAFEAFSRAFPDNCVFLVDTYDTLQGVRNAIAVGRELKARGHRMVGVRLDSGDLAYFSVEARRMLDEAGLESSVVMASNELDEYLIRSLKDQGAAIGAWGVGTKLVTAFDEPALGGVYKLTALRRRGGAWEPKLKLSEQTAKISVPGRHEVYRYFGRNGLFMADAIVDDGEPPERIESIVDPNDPHHQKTLFGYTQAEPLLEPVMREGKVLREPPGLPLVRQRVHRQFELLHAGHKRFENPHVYPVGMSPRLQAIREAMIHDLRRQAAAGE